MRILDHTGNDSYPIKQNLPKDAKIRILNALDDSQQIAVHANHQHIAVILYGQQTTEYFRLPSGICTIAIFADEQDGGEVLRKNLAIGPGKNYTLAIAGQGENIELLMIENQPEVPAGEAKMRFFHLSMDTAVLDVAVKERDVVFPNVSYKQVTSYLGLTPMTVDLELRTSGEKAIVYPMPKLRFAVDEAYTIVFMGIEKNLLILTD